MEIITSPIWNFLKSPSDHWTLYPYAPELSPGVSSRLFTRLILSGKLYEHLAEIDRASRQRMEQIIPRLAQAEGVDEKLKATDQMAWVGRMNSIR